MNLWAPGIKTGYYGQGRGSLEARLLPDLTAIVRVDINRKADVGGSYPLWFTQLPQAQARTLYRQHSQVNP